MTDPREPAPAAAAARPLVYLDNGATTRVDPAVAAVMHACLVSDFGNPSSLHRVGLTAARIVREARETLAGILRVAEDEILFTSGGTEADVLAVRGAALVRLHAWRAAGAAGPPPNVVCSAIEHPAVHEACASLVAEGVEFREAPVDRAGIVDLAALRDRVDDRTALVAVMHANNEIGTIQPIAAIGAWLKDAFPRARFHVDAVQSFTKEPIDVHAARVDTLALSAHKLHGPKGTGALWVRRGVTLHPLLFGGSQQRKVRPGTENVAGIAGFATAARLAMATAEADTTRMRALRDRLIEGLCRTVPDTSLNGHPTNRLCNNVHVNVHGCQAETLLHFLEAEGVVASSGSACHASEHGPSGVLKAIGHTRDEGSLRLTLSRETTADDIARALTAVSTVAPLVRQLNRGRAPKSDRTGRPRTP